MSQVVIGDLILYTNISRVSDQNGVSLLYIMLEIHHSGQEPLICCKEAYDSTYKPRHIMLIVADKKPPKKTIWEKYSLPILHKFHIITIDFLALTLI